MHAIGKVFPGGKKHKFPIEKLKFIVQLSHTKFMQLLY